MTRLTRHIRSNAVAYLALFVALGGTSYAALHLPANSVGGRQIRNHVIDPVKLNPKYIAGSVRAWASVNAKGKIVASSGGAKIVASVGADQHHLDRQNQLVACLAIATVKQPDGPGGPPNPGVRRCVASLPAGAGCDSVSSDGVLGDTGRRDARLGSRTSYQLPVPFLRVEFGAVMHPAAVPPSERTFASCLESRMRRGPEHFGSGSCGTWTRGPGVMRPVAKPRILRLPQRRLPAINGLILDPKATAKSGAQRRLADRTLCGHCCRRSMGASS